MPFTVTGTNAIGAKVLKFEHAKQALDAVLKFESEGLQKIVVKDDLRRTITRDQLILLVYPNG